ncbi:hypothetical protein AB0E63_00860 [Kribbella sp. NPDC026596]|uniref:hypothetical protein n=1 Tax=Kribbella sp. NPDC026596 TaxID=3155122 RepID=UPI00340FE221
MDQTLVSARPWIISSGARAGRRTCDTNTWRLEKVGATPADGLGGVVRRRAGARQGVVRVGVGLPAGDRRGDRDHRVDSAALEAGRVAYIFLRQLSTDLG